MAKIEKYTYKYPRPAVSTDCIIFGYDGKKIKVLLIERGIEPFKGKPALPGGFVRENETAEACALRELYTETGVKDVYIEQLYTFSAINRDPRTRVISIAYFSLINLNHYQLKAGDDAKATQWFDIENIPALAFDHSAILQAAIERLQNKIRYQPIGFELLPPNFTLSQLQNLYEKILRTQLDKRNFRKKILKTTILTKLDKKIQQKTGRPAYLYQFNKKQYEKLQKSGFNFEL